MTEQYKCPSCGAALSAGILNGLCPACALRGALEKGVAAETDEPLDPLLPSSCAPGPGIRVYYFGDYELLEEISHGGMGVVFRARQLSLNRLVAVKMILAGRLASDLEVKRFKAEAEAAAGLQHPNIVAIHEVGIFQGQHYFSMDLVTGKDLGTLVREHPLSAAQAAQYARTIAEAVQYAHEQGVLHRDLKPSNVLIDHNNQPRVTDFGLAKQLKSDSETTVSGQVVGSPNYISPEQAAGRKTEVGPETDIYSLGAILYHLVTGRPPFAAETVQATLVQVLQQEPVPPRALNPQVPRDLETICLKCLEKDLARRYHTARALAEELGRFLRNEPILARPVSTAGRAWRWCRRNPALAIASSSGLLLLVAGLVVSTWLAVRATRAEHKQIELRRQTEMAEQAALVEARRSEQVAQFLKDALGSVGPSVALGRDTKLLREILERTAFRVGKDLTNQPGVEADLRTVLGDVYQELGDYGQAEAMHRRALALRKALPTREDAKAAVSLSNLALALERQGKLNEAEAAYHEALVLRNGLWGAESPAAGAVLSHLGNMHWRQSRFSEAEACYREALAIYRKRLGNEHQDTAGVLGNLAMLAGTLGRESEAESGFREALAIQRKLLPHDHPVVAKSLSNLATCLRGQGKLDEAETLYREALSIRRKLLGDEHPDLAISLYNFGNLLSRQGKAEEAEATLRESLAIRRKCLGNEHTDTALSLSSLAELLAAQARPAEAEAMLREALAIRRNAWNRDHEDIAKSLTALAVVLAAEDQLGEAEALHAEALAMLRRLLATNHPDVTKSLNNLVGVLKREGKLAAADRVEQEDLAIRQRAQTNGVVQPGEPDRRTN